MCWGPAACLPLPRSWARAYVAALKPDTEAHPVQSLQHVRDEATEGMIDFHVHTLPDTFGRTVDSVEAARTARALGMRAIVLKGGAFETVTRAAQANADVGGRLRVFGGVVLNWPMGGINPAAVEAMVTLRGGGVEGLGRVVWLPSIHARNHHERFGIPQPGVEVFDGTRLVPAMREILALCAEYELVLETGHLSAQEALAVIREAGAAGVERIVCTHADYDPINMTIDEQREAARLGAYIEHAYMGVFLGPDCPEERFRPWRGTSVEQMAAAIKAVGAERCILASDLGAAPLVKPAEGYLAFVRRLREFDVGDRELDRMGRHNPAQLLGL